MTGSVHGGSALYYPYLEDIDRRWLMLAALYYDHLWRIVPPKWDVWDSHDVQQFVDAGVLRNRDAGTAADAIADEFEGFLAHTLSSPDKTRNLLNDLRLSRGIKRISVGKMVYRLALRLREKGLLSSTEENYYRVDDLTGALYMLFLAKRLAGTLPLISDQPVFQQLVYGTNGVEETSTTPTGAMAYRLASVVIKTVVPCDIGNVPISTILKIHKESAEERITFFEAISTMASDLEVIRDSRDADDAIAHRQAAIARSIDGFKARLKGHKVAFVSGFMGISVPSVATWGFGISNHIALTALGAIAAGAFTVKTLNELKTSKLESHWTYLQTLRSELEEYTPNEDFIGLHLGA